MVHMYRFFGCLSHKNKMLRQLSKLWGHRTPMKNKTIARFFKIHLISKIITINTNSFGHIYINYFSLIIIHFLIQFAVFITKSKVNRQTNEQPTTEINPIPNT